jgi:O-antigen/teichoic acid export membrane protein
MSILLVGPILLIFFPEEYHSALKLLPWIILGAMFIGYYYIPMNIISMTVGITTIAPIITLIAGSTNIGLNLFFVPKIGTIAAAYNTSIGYGILLILMSVVAYRLRPLNLEWKRLLKIVLVSLLLGSIGLSLMQFSAWVNFIIGLGIVFVFPICLWGIGFFDKKENMALKNALQRAVNYLGF